ncbi:hypothetical protein [Flavobacterium panacagri]|uniref:hypothetical protein n=1 Tax=Flavobacterium panacagri TaxID=3034146 RepID=UPI0025A5F552|nr:hypothetical protein [Flavobacterium panacagri]
MGNEKESQGKQILLGIFITGLGVYSYRLFGKLMTNDNSAMSVACELFGKYLLSAFLFVIGIKTLYAGIKGTINQEEEDEQFEQIEPTTNQELLNYKPENNEPQNIKVDIRNEEFGVKKTLNYREDFIGNKIRMESNTYTEYTNYVSDVKNKQLYFETLIYLMRFIEKQDKSVAISTNKFYQLALENVDEIENLDIIELEKRILENAQKCEIEFNDVEIGSLLRNSINILKGKFVISPAVTNLYFKLFDVMKIQALNKEVYFYSLLG